ncbi:minor histocompatibility antigen H13-like [Paramacrobiotus metropolitanus]|uniref:minor histocompatibility antigen H13-like n=1 Tax=Paramacrobiotus metropolitanus TaxID=2943436 RepID=UPI002445D6FC|nr:minor histocompatibility antigen H13-like [Paramacrobiotus metropolitanus]
MSFGELVGKQLGAVVENLGKAFRDAFAQTEGLDLKVNGTNVSALDGLGGNGTNGTDAALSGKKIPATLQGLLTAYTGLVIMALLPIYLGSFKSVKFQKHSKTLPKDKQPEKMSAKDAMMFPVIASCALFGLYLLFHFFGKEYVNYLLTSYFFVLGILSLTNFLAPLTERLPLIPREPRFRLSFTAKTGDTVVPHVELEFGYANVLAFLLSVGCGVWYMLQKHWIANNLFGLAFSLNAIELLTLNTVMTGVILLGGLFFYDIFWVFGSNVMVFVAKSFEAPIKLIFPQDLWEHGFFAKNFAMLGLGDIVIPGIFIALMLRFDHHMQEKSGRRFHWYFRATFLAYFLGLLATIVVMHVFKHAQPALLYLVPACLGVPLLLALVKGDLREMFKYEDHPATPADADADKKTD